MRNPLSLCAVALSIALASPASSAPAPINLTFDRSIWQVVDPSGVPAAVLAKGKCAGTLVAARSDINESADNWHARVGSYDVPLHCVSLLSAANAKDPSVDATQLELTVGVSLFSGANRKFSLNGYPVAAPHDPKGSELTFVAATPPPPPAAKNDGKTHAGTHRAGTHRAGTHRAGTHRAGTHRARAHHTAAHRAGAPAGAHKGARADSAAVTPGERFWMIPSERSAYDEATDQKKKPSADAVAKAETAARAAVLNNLRPATRADYKRLVDAKSYDKIDALLTKPGLAYSGSEVMLDDGERAKLAKIVKTKDAHTDLKYDNALIQYDSEMRPLLGPTSKTVPMPSEHVRAHQIVMQYRAMIQPDAKPGVGQDGKPIELTKDAFAKIPDPKTRDALWNEYAALWPKTKDEEKDALNKTYLGKIAALVAAATPAGKTNPTVEPLDPSKITSLEPESSPSALKHYSKDQQKQYCSMLRSDGGTGSNCGESAAERVMSAEKVCNQRFPNVDDKSKDQAKSTAVQKNRTACVAQINACKSQPGGVSAGTVDSTKLPKDIRDYCAGLLATLPSDPGANQNVGAPTKPSASLEKSPCAAAAKAGTGQADASASGQAGKDTDPCPKPDDSKKDDNFYENMGNGAAIGLAGMLLASFLGGPALMLAVGLASGVGAYYVSKSITEPADKKK